MKEEERKRLLANARSRGTSMSPPNPGKPVQTSFSGPGQKTNPFKLPSASGGKKHKRL